VGKVGLAEAWSWGEMDSRTQDGGGEGKGEWGIRRRWRVRVCMMLETWAQGSPRHSSGGIEGRDDQTVRSFHPKWDFGRAFMNMRC